ncbi:MAG: hypothetical protein IPK59_12865 [Rhodospirillaceae bacterium]|nr:hypothetical protein [Rhodospirillaceae bacterium]
MLGLSVTNSALAGGAGQDNGIGDPRDPGTHVGALISKDHMMKVLRCIEAG